MVEQPKKGRIGRFAIIGCGVLVTLCIAFFGLGAVLNAISPATQAPLLPPDTRTPLSPQSTQAATATEAATQARSTVATSATPKATITSLPTLRTVATTAASTQAAATRTRAPAFTATTGAVDTPVPADTPPPAATQEPTQAAASITLVSLTTPRDPGQDASLIVQVTAGADCFLTYYAPSGAKSGADGLGAKTADGNGYCQWTWNIGSRTGAGTGKLVVTSSGQTARYDIVIN